MEEDRADSYDDAFCECPLPPLVFRQVIKNSWEPAMQASVLSITLRYGKYNKLGKETSFMFIVLQWMPLKSLQLTFASNYPSCTTPNW